MTVLQLKTAPASEPVNLNELKNELRIELDNTDSDALLTSLLLASRYHVEALCGPIITQTWLQYENAWPCGAVLGIGKVRLQSVSLVKYTDIDSVTSTFSSGNYTVDAKNEYDPAIILNVDASWPSDSLHPNNPIEIEFICGYGLAASVPENLRIAIILYAEQLFDGIDRQSMVDALLNNFMIRGF